MPANPTRQPVRRWPGNAVRLLVAVAVLWGGYQLLVYPPPTVELVVGIAVALLAASGAAVAYTVLWPGYRIDRRLLIRTLGLPMAVARDFIVLTELVAAAVIHRTRLSGSSRWVPLSTSGTEAEAEETVRGARMATAILESVAPNRVAVGFDRKTGRRLLVHEMRPT